jgi:hypothetical protein
MKKWLLVTAFVFIAALTSIYVFIPARLEIVQITPVHCSTPGAYRTLTTREKWSSWWPAARSNGYAFFYKNNSFEITKTLMNTFEIRIHQNDHPINSSIHLIPLSGDSTNIEWRCSFSAGVNPIKRIQHYQEAVNLKKDMAAILSHFKSFAEKKENIYGISFREVIFKDSLLISTKSTTVSYPSVTDIYSLINTLKKYSAAHQAQQTGNPYLNITPLNPFGFQVMTAIPVDRAIPANSRFFHQRIPLNRFQVTRVHGGVGMVNLALQQFQLYIQDYRRTLMALPFQQLITDRSTEPDTTRWITDIYIPLF